MTRYWLELANQWPKWLDSFCDSILTRLNQVMTTTLTRLEKILDDSDSTKMTRAHHCFQPVAIETTCAYGKSTAPFLSCLGKKLVYISGNPREQQWRHQRLSLAVIRGNTASILAGVQVWSDFSHPQCINQCFCPSLASLQRIAIAFRMSVFSVSFIVFSMFSVNPLRSIVLLPFSAILTNLILFIFHVPNTTVLLFTVKPFCNLSLPLSAQPHLGVLCAWSNTHTMAVLHHGL